VRKSVLLGKQLLIILGGEMKKFGCLVFASAFIFTFFYVCEKAVTEASLNPLS